VTSEPATSAKPTLPRRSSEPPDAVIQAAVEVIDVTRVYQLDGVSVPALRGVSLRVDRGDYLAIVGPSGSGKSTLMHLLGGLDRPTTGRLMLGGTDVSALSAAQLAQVRNEVIGFVFQSFHLLTRTTARDNVALPLIYRGLPRGERRRRADQLSGGEQQRVAIARALVTEPAVLLADEPTGNLDSRSGEQVLTLLEDLNRERGVAVAIVTHDASVAARARRRVTMRDGQIVALTDDSVIESAAVAGVPKAGAP
jgi:putative ABC transport system ATP-binding protein